MEMINGLKNSDRRDMHNFMHISPKQNLNFNRYYNQREYTNKRCLTLNPSKMNMVHDF